MAKEKLAQNSFVNGQYDRSVQSKEKTAFVGSGISKCLNVLSGEKGELRKRLGTKFLKEINEAAVLVPYRNGENDLILAFKPNKLDVYRYTESGLEEYQHYTESQFIQRWTGNTTNGYTVASSYASNSAYTTFILPRTAYTSPFQPIRVQGWHYNGGGTANLQNNLEYYITLPNDNVISRISFMFGSDVGTDAPANPYIGYSEAILQYSDDGQTWNTCKTVMESQAGNKPEYYINTGYSPIGSGAKHAVMAYDIVQDTDSGAHKYWRVVFSQKLDHAYKSNPVLNTQFYFRSTDTVYQTITTDITDVSKIKYSQNKNLMKITDGEHTPKAFSVATTVSYSDFTPSGTPNIWQDNGYPKAVQYFQNRLFFAGFDINPNLVLGSKFDNENVFSVSGQTVEYDDYLELKCNELKNRIDNIVGGQNILYCFSEDGISFIDGGSTGLLATNQNIEFHLKNRMPAGDVMPTYKDDIMLYTSSDRVKLYAIDYDLLVSRFQVDDIAKYAQDITKNKIIKIQYVNNESKLVYGLTDNGEGFALNYTKGAFQGFFPINTDGYIYDILSVKEGRDYKLLMVVQHGGYWYIEEKLDKGSYENTTDPLITAEGRKWATFDNINKNIALDCYQTYDKSFAADIQLSEDKSYILTNSDLSLFLNQSLMFGQLNNDKELCFAVPTSVHTSEYLVRKFIKSGDSSVFRYCIVGDSAAKVHIYNEVGKFVGFGILISFGQNQTQLKDSDNNTYNNFRDTNPPENQQLQDGYNIELEDIRGNSNTYDTVYPEFTEAAVNFPADTEIEVLGEGKYIGKFNVVRKTGSRPLYGWHYNTEVVYTDSTTPELNDVLYDENEQPITRYYQNTVQGYDPVADEITVNAELVEEQTGSLYGWGNDIYTLSATPSAGDLLYNADGTPYTRFYDNKVDSYSNGVINVVDGYTQLPARYAWTSTIGTIYTSPEDEMYAECALYPHSKPFAYYVKPEFTKHEGIAWQIDCYGMTMTYNGNTYSRNSEIDGIYYNFINSRQNMIGFGNYLIPLADIVYGCSTHGDQQIRNLEVETRIYQNNSTETPTHIELTNIDFNPYFYVLYKEGTRYADTPYVLENIYFRDNNSDLPAGQQKITTAYSRNSSIDIPSQIIRTILTKDFVRTPEIDIYNDINIVNLSLPAHKITYGLYYDSYAYFTIQVPYDSMKTVQEISLQVQDTMHLAVGTKLSDMQVLEEINDHTYYDLTNITMNESYRVVPGDTPEWTKYVVLKSDKGLPFTVNAIEVIMNHSNEGGN